MTYLKCLLSLVIFVPAFAILGAEGWGGDWYGWVIGGIVGVFFALVFGGNPDWKIWDYFYGQSTTPHDES